MLGLWAQVAAIRGRQEDTHGNLNGRQMGVRGIMDEHVQQGGLRGEKAQYPDGIGYCIWYPWEDDTDAGLCFDFPEEDMDDLIALLQGLRVAEARVHEDE